MSTIYKGDELTRLLSGRRILLAGYGREGKSSEQLIRRLLPQDDITIAEGNENIQQEARKGYDMVVKSPGIPTFIFEGHCPLDIITSQTDLFLQVYASQTIGVTGTKGKSTTTNLIAAAMRRHNPHTLMAGNMGIPLFDIIDQIDADTTIVAEFSCHQLENIHRAPHTAILLNLFQEHLDHYHSYLDYQIAKLQIALRQQSEDLFFYCTDNDTLKHLVEQYQTQMHGTVFPYSLHSSLAEQLKELPSHLTGNHNLSNIVVARMATQAWGVDDTTFTQALADFHGLEHRLECVGTYHGITFYNDSISTIPAACMAAVSSLSKVDTLILGGFDRGIDYSVLVPFIQQSTIRNIVLIGEAGHRIGKLLQESHADQGRNILYENNYELIVQWCYKHTAAGKTCLLSPAAASYDAFKNFEHRGRTFKELVLRYGNN